ncbi:hypothetical protein B0H19DRAFT_1065881 [Mycena capillaripes]|nr:hypothetical protein B0H19DRAFT_1065881 [Mycena capillaripes]
MAGVGADTETVGRKRQPLGGEGFHVLSGSLRSQGGRGGQEVGAAGPIQRAFIGVPVPGCRVSRPMRFPATFSTLRAQELELHGCVIFERWGSSPAISKGWRVQNRWTKTIQNFPVRTRNLNDHHQSAITRSDRSVPKCGKHSRKFTSKLGIEAFSCVLHL